MTTFLTKLFTGKTQQPIKSAGYREEPIGGFAHPTLQAKNKQLEQMIQEVSASPIPVSQKDQLVIALKKMRAAVDSKGNLDLEKLPEKTMQEIEQHLLSVSKAAAKPKPVTKPLVQPSTRPAAKASTPAPAPKPVVKKKPLAEVKQAIYCNTDIPLAGKSFAIQAAEISDRFTNSAGVLEESRMSTTDHWMLRRAERKLSEIISNHKTKK